MYLNEFMSMILLGFIFLSGLVIGMFISTYKFAKLSREIREEDARFLALISLNEIRHVVEEKVKEMFNDMRRLHEKEKKEKRTVRRPAKQNKEVAGETKKE